MSEILEKEKVTQPDHSGYEYLVGKQLKPEFPAKVLAELEASGILAT